MSNGAGLRIVTGIAVMLAVAAGIGTLMEYKANTALNR
jgi:hypothetical protein